MPPVSRLYIRGVKAQALIAAVVVFFVAGCGGDKPKTAEYGWTQFRQDYPELTSACEVSEKSDVDKVVCWGIHGVKAKSARISAQSLPVGKARSDLLTAFDSYSETIAEFDKQKCDAASISRDPCSYTVHKLGFYDDSIQSTIRKASDAQS